MFEFNLKKTSIYSAIQYERFFNLVLLLKKIFAFTSLASFVWFFINQKEQVVGLSLVCFVFFLVAKILESFFNSKLKRPDTKIQIEQALARPEDFNLAEFLDFEAGRAVAKTIKATKNKEPNSSKLLYWLLKTNPKLEFVFSRALLDFKEIKEQLKKGGKAFDESNFYPLIFEAMRIAQVKGHSRIQAGDLLIALVKTEPVLKQALIKANLSGKDIATLVWWQEINKQEVAHGKRFWEYENLARRGSIGRDWAAGYTINLDQYSIDWKRVIEKRGFEEIIGHDKEIKKLEILLSQEIENNVLLIGESGIGRKSIVHALAKKAFLGQSTPAINYKRIVELDLAALFARTKSEEETESLLETVFQEVVQAGNVILVIDEFPNFLVGQRRPGAVDISGIIGRYLKMPQFQMIGICDVSGFYKYIEPNPGLSRLFDKITIEEVSEKETILILTNRIPFYEKKYKKFISYQALRDIVAYSAKYITDTPFPKKAVDLLDEVFVYASRYIKNRVILPEHVAKIVTEKIKIPVGEIETKEKETLLNLEALIHQRIINQDEAVNEISEAMRRARAEITIRKGPIGAFLFMGPTGVGKTETAKTLTEIYFGAEERMIRLDMSEFQDPKDIARLIGTPEQEGLLTTQAKQKPFSLILLDEIEKAHYSVLNLFLQVLDEGFLSDGVGRRVSFKNTIIIATSNAGYKVILQALRKQTEWSDVKQKLLDYLFENAIFRPEFINRFDGVVVFRPLTPENLLEIVHLMLNKLKKNLAQKHIEFEITEPLKKRIVELGYSPVFGAREIRRVIQDKVENVLATGLLRGELKRGDRIIISDKFEIIKQ